MEKRFYVSGVKYHELYKIIDEIQEGDELDLVPEPTNRYDANAIKLIYTPLIMDFDNDEDESFMVGYVPAKIAAEIIGEVANLTCTVLDVNAGGKPWEQLKVAITGGKDA